MTLYTCIVCVRLPFLPFFFWFLFVVIQQINRWWAMVRVLDLVRSVGHRWNAPEGRIYKAAEVVCLNVGDTHTSHSMDYILVEVRVISLPAVQRAVAFVAQHHRRASHYQSKNIRLVILVGVSTGLIVAMYPTRICAVLLRLRACGFQPICGIKKYSIFVMYLLAEKCHMSTAYFFCVAINE